MSDTIGLDALIQSKDVREYVLKTGWAFTDAQKATLLANSWIGKLPLDAQFLHLRALRDQTDDMELKEQITTYQDRMERALQEFKENRDRSCVYILKVEDDEWGTSYHHISPEGFFYEWELAFEYGHRTAQEFQIEKLHIANEKIYIPDSDAVAENANGGNDDFVTAYMEFDKTGAPIYFSHECDNGTKEKFVSAFFPLPNPFERGDIIRRVGSDRAEDYGIVETSQEQCRKDYERWEKGTPFHMEFGDDRIRVVFLCDDGTFSHAHVIPMYLERYQPQRVTHDTVDGTRDNLLLCASAMYRGDGSLDELWFSTMEYQKAKKKAESSYN